jgi:hypothetical protein
MIEGNYQFILQVEAHTLMVQQRRERMLRDEPRADHRGLVRDTIAGVGSMLVRLGTSLERLARVDEQVPVDV